jgi:indole-3-glycerol phosphate synthase
MQILNDHLPHLVASAKTRIDRGYYDIGETSFTHSVHSLSRALQKTEKTPVITEVKFSSPSIGKIRTIEDPVELAKQMVDGGACAISVLSDPDNFNGSLTTLAKVSANVNLPVLMKDIVVSPRQLQAAAHMGASAIVMISEIFSRGLAEVSLDVMIGEARRLGLETLLEANTSVEFGSMMKYSPDVYGINNRNLSTFHVDLSTTEKILSENGRNIDRPIVSESGIESVIDIQRLKRAGASAFLVGTSIMQSENIALKVRELVNA